MARYYRRNFQCTDENCNKQKLLKYKWDDDLKPEICECGKEMEEIFEEDKQSASYLKFSSMSQEGKAAVLKARSHKHFNKEIKERKHQMNKDMRDGFLGK